MSWCSLWMQHKSTERNEKGRPIAAGIICGKDLDMGYKIVEGRNGNLSSSFLSPHLNSSIPMINATCVSSSVSSCLGGVSGVMEGMKRDRKPADKDLYKGYRVEE